MAPALRVEVDQDRSLGSSGLSWTFRATEFCTFSQPLDLLNLGGISTFWQGALAPMDQLPDSSSGRGFTLALLWMIPTNCIPEGRMAPGVDDFRELLRPVAFAALRYLLLGPSLPGEQAYQALMASFPGSHHSLCCPDTTVRNWKPRVLPACAAHQT